MAIGTPVSRYGQQLSGQPGSSAISPASTIAAGTQAILFVWIGNQDKYVTSVTDTAGNTWAVDATHTPVPPGAALSVASCRVATQITTGDTITVNYAVSTSGYVSLFVCEVSGLDDTSAFDKSSTGTTTTGTAIDAGTTATLSQADEIAFAQTANFSFSGFTAGGTWTGVTVPDSSFDGLEYKIVSSVSAITADGTQGGSAASAGLTVTYKMALVTTQSLLASADSVDGTWTDQDGGTNLAAAIDETVANNADYIRSGLSPSNSGCRVKLQAGANPSIDTNHDIFWRVGKLGSQTIDMTVKLYQGGGNVQGAGTLIASFDRTNVSTTITQYDETLSEGQAATITDYTDLYLEFYANAP
jgi:hypothetical protein